MDSGYGWCQSCGALVFNSPQCHKCDGKVRPFCVDITLVKQAERITELEAGVLQIVSDSNKLQIEAKQRIKDLEEDINKIRLVSGRSYKLPVTSVAAMKNLKVINKRCEKALKGQMIWKDIK